MRGKETERRAVVVVVAVVAAAVVVVIIVVVVVVCCLTSQPHSSESQRWICSDDCTCCRREIEVADQTFYLNQSQYTDTRPTSPSADLITPGAWQGSHWSTTGMTRSGQNPHGAERRETWSRNSQQIFADRHYYLQDCLWSGTRVTPTLSFRLSIPGGVGSE